jgi:hypothetical protein
MPIILTCYLRISAKNKLVAPRLCRETKRVFSKHEQYDRMIFGSAILEERDGKRSSTEAAQSTRHSPQGGESGFDASKKVKGRNVRIGM